MWASSSCHNRYNRCIRVEYVGFYLIWPNSNDNCHSIDYDKKNYIKLKVDINSIQIRFQRFQGIFSKCIVCHFIFVVKKSKKRKYFTVIYKQQTNDTSSYEAKRLICKVMYKRSSKFSRIYKSCNELYRIWDFDWLTIFYRIYHFCLLFEKLK